MADALTVFISYAHKDEIFRRELEKHLQALKRQALIEVWDDRDIGAGTEWECQIRDTLNRAHIILLLISADFLASDYCYSIEMQRAIERHKAHEARVIPIILRPTNWHIPPLAILQALPTDGKPVTDTAWPTQDHAFLDVEQGIGKVVQELRALAAGHSEMAVGRYEQALAAYDQALQLDQHSAAAHLGKGGALVGLNRYEDAVDAYDQALRFDPYRAEVYSRKARALLHLDRYEDALQAYGRALQLDPKAPELENGRGQVLLGLKRHQEALGAFDQAIALDPHITAAHRGKGDVLGQLRRYEEALAAFDQAIHLNPGSADLYVSRGCVLEELAKQAFEKAKELDPSQEKLMNQAEHVRAQMKSAINIEKVTLLQTIPYLEKAVDWYDQRCLKAITISPDGQFLAGANQGGTKLWDVKTGKVEGEVGGIRDLIPPLLFSSDGQTLLGSNQDKDQKKKTIQTWNFRTGRLVTTSIEYDLDPAVISPDGKILVGRKERRGSGYRTDVLWALNLSTQELGEYELEVSSGGPNSYPDSINALTASAEGKIIIGGISRPRDDWPRYDQLLCLWHSPTFRLLHILSDLHITMALAVSPDDQVFASAHGSGVIKLWSLPTAQLLFICIGHEGGITALTFSADGRQLVSASADGTIKIWKIE